MSLYNLMFGMNPNAEALLELLGKTHADFGRFRDVSLGEDAEIVVLTRCGGGNRDDYEDMFAEMAEHPWYVTDYDCDFDSTYAEIVFAPTNDDESVAKIKRMAARLHAEATGDL